MFTEDWYTDSQCDNLTLLIKTVKYLDGDIIEIGCWEGKSTSFLANSCYPEIVLCNDTWLGNINESLVTNKIHTTEILCKERDVYSKFIENMNILTQKNYKVIKKDCIEWLKEYNGKIKFIHIDACHDYKSVFDTIKLVLPKMVKGGIICGDDFLSAGMHRYDLNGGVERAVRELLPEFKNIDNLWYYIQA